MLCLYHGCVLCPRDNSVSLIFFVGFAGGLLEDKDFSVKVQLILRFLILKKLCLEIEIWTY